MARIYLVRHGEASAGWGTDRDPGLSEQGRAEAATVAEHLALLGPLPVWVSPLRRCRETAAPLEARWETTAQVVPTIAEIEAPSADLTERANWLRGALASTWSQLEPGPVAWRRRLLDTVTGIDTDTVLVTHFVVVNAVIGAAADDDRVMIERLANGSITIVDLTAGGELRLVEAGVVARSEVL